VVDVQKNSKRRRRGGRPGALTVLLVALATRKSGVTASRHTTPEASMAKR
jgi:hypothetical protein